VTEKGIKTSGTGLSEQLQPSDSQLPQVQGNTSKDRSRRTKDHVHDSVSRTSSELHAKATVAGSSRLPSPIPEDSTVKLCLDTHTNTTISTSASKTSEYSDQGSTIAGASVPSASGVEVVMTSVELESPNTILRRKLHRGIYTVDSSGLPHRPSHPHDHASFNSAGAGMAPFPMKRKPSLSSVRSHVPTGINTDPGTFAMCVHESSPVGTYLKHAPLAEDKSPGEGNINGNDSDFDWEEDKIYEDREKEAVSSAEMIATIESDVCCRPLHGRIRQEFDHPLLPDTQVLPPPHPHTSSQNHYPGRERETLYGRRHWQPSRILCNPIPDRCSSLFTSLALSRSRSRLKLTMGSSLILQDPYGSLF